MPKSKQTQVVAPDNGEVRWKALYQIGGVCGLLISALIVLAIVIYFIWPYQPGLTSPANIFTTIQTNTLSGLMSLDFFMLVLTFFVVPFFLALYVATKDANESYALIALVFGLISCVLAFIMRPIAEMFYLSSQYATATTEAARSQYLAAGEALSALFNGTAWIIYFITFGVELLITSVLMLRISAFSKVTAYLGIFLTIGLLSVLAVIVPSLAALATMINLLTTLIWAIWNVLVARTLFQLARGAVTASQ